ncbi:F-type ATPase subunit b [Actinomyces bovis]|uniref:ATP synthase subunit b n=1 Tax=Actinomyces bovis TaxID=1658 RepID=A0ABY1VL20_9ACTO|nr:F0F1 ATP synthase subunit B [Actinomyces bovis]SPT52799.1 F-type ATPase subunit b [Actinomyces bovis]VEG54840.1 F-type ATPase subunit b [Actinomyces israelii]
MTLSAALPMVLAAADHQEGGAPEGIWLFVPHVADLLWGTVCFAVIALVLIKYALPRFNAVMDERTAKIEEGLALTEQAKQGQAEAEAKATSLVEDARIEAARIRENAQTEAKQIIAEARAAAATEAGKALSAAQRQIQADKQAAQISLRSDVGMLAAGLAEKIVGEQLRDTELSSRVIDRFLNDLEAQSVQFSAADVAAATGSQGPQ